MVVLYLDEHRTAHLLPVDDVVFLRQGYIGGRPVGQLPFSGLTLLSAR